MGAFLEKLNIFNNDKNNTNNTTNNNQSVTDTTPLQVSKVFGQRARGRAENLAYTITAITSKHRDMLHVDCRLRTFAAVLQCRRLISKLSVSGFFFDAERDQLVCYRCGQETTLTRLTYDGDGEHQYDHWNWHLMSCTHAKLVYQAGEHLAWIEKRVAEELRRHAPSDGELVVNNNKAAAVAFPQRRTPRLRGLVCKVCYDFNARVVVLPCRHLALCSLCAVSIEQCAVCRGPIRAYLLVYVS